MKHIKIETQIRRELASNVLYANDYAWFCTQVHIYINDIRVGWCHSGLRFLPHTFVSSFRRADCIMKWSAAMRLTIPRHEGCVAGDYEKGGGGWGVVRQPSKPIKFQYCQRFNATANRVLPIFRRLRGASEHQMHTQTAALALYSRERYLSTYTQRTPNTNIDSSGMRLASSVLRNSSDPRARHARCALGWQGEPRGSMYIYKCYRYIYT